MMFDEIAMMKDPNRWPNMVLPVCSKVVTFDHADFCGIMTGEGPVVRRGNLFGGGDMQVIKAYASFEELAKEWRVD